jgi:excisionase family DNA binding protein
MRHPLMTVKEVAVYFKRSESTVRRWIMEGKFPNAFQITSGHYVPIEDVDALRGAREDSHD